MIARIRKWGAGQGLRLSERLLAAIGVEVGDAVEVTAREGSLVITPTRRLRGGLDLAQLVERIPEDYMPEDAGWGTPTGREIW
jgi:antitoxin component of MazEF toxin-antitoxin module